MCGSKSNHENGSSQIPSNSQDQVMFTCYDNVPCGGQVDNADQWDLSRNRNSVGTSGSVGENIVDEVSRATGCSGEGRIPLLIWPVFAASRMVGLMPLAYRPTAVDLSTRNANQVPGLHVSYPWLTLCIVALCVSLFAFNFEFRRLVKVIVDPKTDLKDYIYAVPMLLNTAEGVICVIRALLAAKKLALCLHSAVTTLRRMSSLTASAAIAAGLAPPPSSTSLNIDGCILIIISLAYYTLLITVQVFYGMNHEYIHSAANNAFFIWCRLIPVVVETQFLLVTLLADRAFCALATAVENASSGYIPQHATHAPNASAPAQPPPHQRNSSRTLLLAELRRLHQKVFSVVELANEYFGPQLLFMILQTRLQLITDGYSVVTSLAPDGHSPYMHVLETAILWTRIFHIIYRSEHVLQQDERILHLVYTVDSSSWDRPSSSQLHLLRRQVSALRPSLHTCSFFTLNYNLLLSVVATTSTYLVVLVQFQG